MKVVSKPLLPQYRRSTCCPVRLGATKYLGKPFFEWVNESPRLAAIQSSAFGGAGKAQCIL